MEQAQGSFWEFIKIAGPLITGGLAGAILTYYLNQRNIRKKTARLLVALEKTNYTLLSKDDGLGKLKVSYQGQNMKI